jgi:hypothetical protein
VTDDPERRKLRKALGWVVASWKAAVGIAGGLTVILALVFHPPWGSSSSSDASGTTAKASRCPGVADAKLSRVTVDERVRRRVYLAMHHASQGSASKEELDAVGRVVHFSIAIRGFRGKALPIYWWVLTPGGEPVPEKTLQEQLAQYESPNDCTTGGRREIWVKLPKRSGRFKIEVQLLQPDGRELDDIRTPTFSVRVPPS